MGTIVCMKDGTRALKVPVYDSVLMGANVTVDGSAEPAFSDPYVVREILRTSPSLNYVLECQFPGVVDRWLAVPPVPVPDGFVSVGSRDLVAYTYYKLTDEVVGIVNKFARYEGTLAPYEDLARFVMTYASDPATKERMLYKVATPNLLWNNLVRKAHIDMDKLEETDIFTENKYDTYGRIKLATETAEMSLLLIDIKMSSLCRNDSSLAHRDRRVRRVLKRSPWLNYIKNFTPKVEQ